MVVSRLYNLWKYLEARSILPPPQVGPKRYVKRIVQEVLRILFQPTHLG